MDRTRSGNLDTATRSITSLTMFGRHCDIPGRVHSYRAMIAASNCIFRNRMPTGCVTRFLRGPPMRTVNLTMPNVPINDPNVRCRGGFVPCRIVRLGGSKAARICTSVRSMRRRL